MVERLRRALQRIIRARGIELRKAPHAGFRPLPVFNLAVEALMRARGDALRFVQIGANDGVFVDPLREYVLNRGWTGVLVEPQPRAFADLQRNYAMCADRLAFENLAIGAGADGAGADGAGALTLYLPPADHVAADDGLHARSVVSSDPARVARMTGIERSRLERIDVPAMTLDALFARHGIAELDLLQIDAEGYDWAILRTLDLTRVRPTLIQFEHGHVGRGDIGTAVAALNAAGYDVYYGGHEGDTLAVRRDFIAFR